MFPGGCQIADHTLELCRSEVKTRAVVGRVILDLSLITARNASEHIRRKLRFGEDVLESRNGWEELLIGCKHVRFEQRVGWVILKRRFKVFQELKRRSRIPKFENGINKVTAFLKVRCGIV